MQENLSFIKLFMMSGMTMKSSLWHPQLSETNDFGPLRPGETREEAAERIAKSSVSFSLGEGF